MSPSTVSGDPPETVGVRGAKILTSARRTGIALVVPLIALLLWELAAIAYDISPILFSRPSQISVAFVSGLSGELMESTVRTLMDLAFGLGVCIAIGVPFGLLMGSWKRFDRIVEPLVMSLYNAPYVALFPLIILWFGVDFAATQVLIILFAIFPLIVNARLGVRLLDQSLRRAALAFGATRMEVFWKVALPAAIPSILMGLQLALGRALVGVIVAGLFIGTGGIGYFIGKSSAFLETPEMYAGIAVVMVIAIVLRAGVIWLERATSYPS